MNALQRIYNWLFGKHDDMEISPNRYVWFIAAYARYVAYVAAVNDDGSVNLWVWDTALRTPDWRWFPGMASTRCVAFDALPEAA